MKDLTLSIAGQTIPFRYFESAKGNDCWAVLKNGKMDRFGVKIAALAPALPTSVTITDGSEVTAVTLRAGTTQSGNAKTSFYGKETLPNGEPRMLTVIVSQTSDGNWNLIAKAIPSGAGGGSRVLSLSDL